VNGSLRIIDFGMRLINRPDTWNDASVKAAWDENTPAEIKALMVYAASKTEGERAAFNWVKKNKPGFVFNSVLPDYTASLPPYLCPASKTSSSNASIDWRSPPSQHRIIRNLDCQVIRRKRGYYEPDRLPLVSSPSTCFGVVILPLLTTPQRILRRR
jgi:hypothetical protein